MGKYLLIFFFVLCSVCENYGARILAYIPTSSYSHQVVFRPLWKELSLRGHQITLLTSVPMNDPTVTNLTEINLNFTSYLRVEVYAKLKEVNSLAGLKLLLDTCRIAVDMQLQHKDVQTLLQSDAEFDVVLAEYLTLIPFAFAEKFQCPSIAIMSMEPTEMVYKVFGVPTHPVAYPNLLLPFTKINNLVERVVSVLFDLFFTLYLELYEYKEQNKIVQKHFGENFPTVSELANKLSLLLENTEPMLSKIRPRVPAVIPINGIHRVPVKPLPKEIQKRLDFSTNGFIYFSLGSNVKSEDLPHDLRQIIVEAFAELPYTVLWKFESDDFPNVPKNVYISKWLPQTDVLRHPNLKLFITHGGAQSTEEAVFAKVPLIGMPFVLDQPKNAKRIVDLGFGLSVDYKSLNKNDFKKTIVEVITNPTYRNAISRVSDLAHDHPMSGLDRAVWWIEYVLRHKGATHLRSPALDIPLYQYFMIDVIAVFLVILGILVFVIVFITRRMYKVLRYVINKRFKVKLKTQ